MTMLKLLHPILRIDEREVDFSLRGFSYVRAEVRERLEHIGRTFLRGYHAALEENNQDILGQQLAEIEAEYQGFGFEGAAMALAVLDSLSLSGRRFAEFLAGAGRRHKYILYVGAGWACARLPWLRWRVDAVIRRFDPVLRWLVVDGLGFHEGYFHWPVTIDKGRIPANLSESARHVFYQGLGRSLWFVKGADVPEIAATIAKFKPQYGADAWSGIGVGCAYAGGLHRDEILALREYAGVHYPALAQGAAFAAKARQLAGNPSSYTEVACAELCGVSSERAAALCDETFKQAASYDEWQGLLRMQLRGELSISC